MTCGQILIIEDDRSISEALSELLQSEGYSVVTAFNGQEGLDLLVKSPVLPRVILLDLMMPVKDGFQFRDEQLRNPKIAGVPVVVMSADGHVQEKKARIGALDYIRKPVDVETYLKVVARFCG
jgi:CheY-like chemotaxis protein